MAINGDFVGLDAATLAELKAAFTSCLLAIATAGASYTISGRQFTRADLAQVRQTLAEINYALGQANGTITTRTVAGFGSPYSR